MLSFGLLSGAVAILSARSTAHPTTARQASEPDDATQHFCGDLIRTADEYGSAYAVDVFNCWNTVPFNPAVGSRFVKYWNDTLQFQSTLDYLKDPPSEYQQPAADLVGGLNHVQELIDGNAFANEYQFEAALQNVLYSAHDSHVENTAGLLSSFSFGSTYGLTSLSLDGHQLPKPYLTIDLIYNQTSDGSWQPSAISQINGTDVVDYLTRFAALNSFGTSEPHADWNLLFDSPVIDVLGAWYPLFSGGATFYPGDGLNFTFENGTILDDRWLASYFDPLRTGPLETGGDYYNWFVLGLEPASYNSTAPAQTNNVSSIVYEPPTDFSAFTSAFPIPDILQPNLTIDGWVTGYYLRDASVAVLSIPSFYAADGEQIQSFTATVQRFLTEAKRLGMKKVVVDMQQNGGGDALLAYSTFKQFFPYIDPFAGSVLRAHPMAETIGRTINAYWQTLNESAEDYQQSSANEWIATTKLSAVTDHNFTSWAEFFGPQADTNITSTQRSNTSNYLFDYSAFGGEIPPAILLAPFLGDALYNADDIVMLSDGICTSTCSLFMEMMYLDAGVKKVVIGGRPEPGPMQAPSGSQGARYYGTSELDADIESVNRIDPSTEAILPDRSNQDVFTYFGGVSLRAQIREDDTLPLAMKYDAANCRIFITPETFNNFTNLWKYAAAAIFDSPDLCVEGSTGFASQAADVLPPPTASPPAAVNYSAFGLPDLDFLAGTKTPVLFNNGLPMPDVGGSFGTRAAVLPTTVQPRSYYYGIPAPAAGLRQPAPVRYTIPYSAPPVQPKSQFCSATCQKRRRALGEARDVLA